MCRIHAGKGSAASSQLEELAVSDAINELCSRRVTAVQYAEALLQRIEKHSCINAFAHLDAKKVSVTLWQASICVRGTMLMQQGQVHPACHTRSLHARPYLIALSTKQLTFQVVLQVLRDARAIDDKYAAGEDIKPLCGMAFTVKDNLDVVGVAPPKILMPARVFLKLVQRERILGPPP